MKRSANFGWEAFRDNAVPICCINQLSVIVPLGRTVWSGFFGSERSSRFRFSPQAPRTLLSRKKRSCYHKLHLKIQNIIMCPRFSTFSTYSIAVFHAILYCDHHNTLPSNMVQYRIYNELNLSSFQSLQEECVLSFVSLFFSWQQKQEHNSTSERL